LEERIRAGLGLEVVTSKLTDLAVATSASVRARQMRSFGLTMAALVPLFASVLPWALGKGWSWWPCLVAAVFATLSAVAPSLLWIPYRGWMRLGHGLGFVNSRIFLGIIFYLVVTPLGLLRRVFSADPMNRRWDPRVESYRQTRSADNFVQRMEAPY